jgi:GNAT superfamily N-acetyltransferase
MEFRCVINEFGQEMMPKLIELLATFFVPGDRLLDPEYHNWLYLKNPFGRAKIVYMETDERWAGVMALVPVKLRCGAEVISAYFAVNVLVDPAFQGRNLFSRMITVACDFAKAEDVSLLGHPNAAALKFWQRKKMHFLDELRPAIALPSLARWRFSCRRAYDIQSLHRTAHLLDEMAGETQQWKVAATPEYLAWRFIQHPSNSYRVTIADRHGEACGIQVTKRLKPGVHLLIDQYATASTKSDLLKYLPIVTLCFVSDEQLSGGRIPLRRLPLKKKMPVFLTRFGDPVTRSAASELGLSASDL